jgi:hypothetical protein
LTNGKRFKDRDMTSFNNNNNSENNFTIRDNSSEIATFLPKELIEPLTILSRIRGYRGIDDYILHLIQDELISIKDGAQGGTSEDIIKYLDKRLVGIDRNTTTIEEEKEDLK